MLAFAVAARLGESVIDVGEAIDFSLRDRPPVFWVQAAINMIEADHIVERRKTDANLSAASKRRAKGRGGAIGG